MKQSLSVIVLRLVGRVPLRLAYRFWRFVLPLVLRLDVRECRTTRTNLAIAFPEVGKSELERLTRRSIQDLLYKISDLCRSWSGVDSSVVESPDTLAASGPEILLLPHLGNWERLGEWLSETRQIHALYEPSAMPAVDEFVRSSREQLGYKLYPTNRLGVAGLLRALKSGGSLVILPDQVPEPEGAVLSKFFGEPCLTMTLAVKLARRVPEAKVRVMAALRDAPGHYRVVEQPIDIASLSDEHACQKINNTIEALVQLAPEQYQWEYKRYRGRPDLPDLY